MKTIKFYSVRDTFGFLSNFAPFAITLDGVTWPSSEHYFQALKFEDPAVQQRIRQASSAMDAANLGRDRRSPIRHDWEAVKVQVMYDAVLAKFSQHPELRKQLLATGDARLIEHTTNDRFWGDGGDGTGANMLGQILMRVRSELRKQE